MVLLDEVPNFRPFARQNFPRIVNSQCISFKFGAKRGIRTPTRCREGTYATYNTSASSYSLSHAALDSKSVVKPVTCPVRCESLPDIIGYLTNDFVVLVVVGNHS